MDKIARVRQEIERLMELNKASMESTKKISRINAAGYYEALVDVENFLDTLSEEPMQKFNTDKLQEIAKPATPHKKPTPEDRAKFMEELHEYAESKKPDKSLEEAAENIYKIPFGTRAEDFIAGAEWQASQMPMPEDTVLFQKGVAEGRRLEKDDMMKDAVEGYAVYGKQ